MQTISYCESLHSVVRALAGQLSIPIGCNARCFSGAARHQPTDAACPRVAQQHGLAKGGKPRHLPVPNIFVLDCAASTEPASMSSTPAPISTTDTHQGPFAAHGEFKLWVDGNILRYEARGPFNREALQALDVARGKLVAAWRPRGPVAAIVHWKESALMSPDAFAEYRAGLIRHQKAAKRPVALAWVAPPEVEGMNIMKDLFEDLFAERQTNYRLFDAEQPAQEWVNACLARARNKAPSLAGDGPFK